MFVIYARSAVTGNDVEQHCRGALHVRCRGGQPRAADTLPSGMFGIIPSTTRGACSDRTRVIRFVVTNSSFGRFALSSCSRRAFEVQPPPV